MRFLTWAMRIALFVLLLAFAARNLDPVTLRFYFNLEWRAPLIALLLAFFACGAALGLAAMAGTWLSQRREIARLRGAQERAGGEAPGATQPPVAEG